MSRHKSERLNQVVIWILPGVVPNQLAVKASRSTVYQRKAKKRMWEEEGDMGGRKEGREGR